MSGPTLAPPWLPALALAIAVAGCSGSPTGPRGTPNLSVTRFTAFGDSITWGTASPQAPASRTPGLFAYPVMAPSYSYPAQLQALFAQQYAGQALSVFNEGWPGEAVADGLARIPEAISSNNSEAVLLLDGANDLLGNPSSATTVYIASKLRDMVRAAKAQQPAVKVFLATFPPQTRGTIPYDRGAGRDFVPELNQRIAAVASSEGVTLVDLYAAFPPDLKPYIGVDGLHPTELGFTLMAHAFAAVVQQTLVR
jgi:lysophospholipase L1-like esterase